MSSFIYRFESFSAEIDTSPSLCAERILKSAAYFVRGIRFYELTDCRNRKPLFAVSFAHHTAKHYFEEMFECLLERSGLRAEIVKATEDDPPAHFKHAVGAANASEFEQRGHPFIPPSLKEWAVANSK